MSNGNGNNKEARSEQPRVYEQAPYLQHQFYQKGSDFDFK